MLRIGLLGAGRIGQIHGRNIAAHPAARLAAIADALPEAAAALAEETAAPVAAMEAVLADPQVDAVVIATPTDTHADLIEAATAAGKAVFCEKPVDLDAARIADCLDRVTATGQPLMIGFNRRFDPSFAALKARLDNGEAGAIEMVTILSRDPAPPPVSYIERSGGLFRDMMIHDFDMARFLLGEEPVEVFALGSCLIDPSIGEAGDVDTAAVVLKTASGRVVQISNSRRAPYGYDQRVEVHCQNGMLSAGNWRATTVEVATAEGYRRDPALDFFLDRYREAYRAELSAFIAAVTQGTPISPSGVDGLKAQILADAATLSWRSGRPISLNG